MTNGVRRKSNVSMEHATDAICNEQHTDQVDIKWRNGGALRTAQRDDDEDGGDDDEVGATRDFSMMRCVGLQ